MTVLVFTGVVYPFACAGVNWNLNMWSLYGLLLCNIDDTF